jgi:predicted ATPase
VFNEDLNIITGSNGSGKTTLLKLIWYLISGNFEQIITDIPFRSFSIETESYFLAATQVEPGKGELYCRFADEAIIDGPFKIPSQSRDDYERIYQFAQRIAQMVHGSLFFPSFRRIEGGFARSSPHNSPDDFFRQRWLEFGDGATELLRGALSGLSTEVSAFNHRFITSISTYDIIELLTERYTDVSSKTNQVHATLSKQITQEISETKPPDDTEAVLESIQKRVEQATEESELLLRPFSVLEEQIGDMFEHKGIHITAGITFGDAKKAIQSDRLSAGEKQLLSFLCYNTFSENTVIFIDEPELSLHVDWQRLLLPTLLAHEQDNQYFIATHTPFIYANYPEKEFLLDNDYGENSWEGDGRP